MTLQLNETVLPFSSTIDFLCLTEKDYSQELTGKWWRLLKQSDWSRLEEVISTRQWCDLLILFINQSKTTDEFFWKISRLQFEPTNTPTAITSILIDLKTVRRYDSNLLLSIKSFFETIRDLIDHSEDSASTTTN